MITDQAKEAITHLQLIATQAEHQLRMAIAQAKVDGASWAEIAEIIGGTRQAAQQRHADYVAIVELKQQAGTRSELDPSSWQVTIHKTATPAALGGAGKNQHAQQVD